MRFRIASFNVENLLTHGVRYYDRLIYTPEESETKFAWIAATLDRARADIVGIQEVWFEDALKDVAARSSFFKSGAHVVAPGATLADNLDGKVARRPRLGLISRFPVKSVEVFARFPPTADLTIPLRTDTGAVANIPIAIAHFQRPPLRAVVDVDGLELVVYVAHLKSKGPMIRFGEDGDDAYVGADITVISPKVPGYILSAAVTDNQIVHAGDLLVLNDTKVIPARIWSRAGG